MTAPISGVIVTTGTGATGWARSIRRQRASDLRLPQSTEPRLAFFVREAWPSIATGTKRCEGMLESGESLEIVSRMNEGGVIFGDGIEDDHVEFKWGRTAAVSIADVRLRLLREC